MQGRPLPISPLDSYHNEPDSVLKRPPSTSWLWAGFVCLILLVGLRFEILQRRSSAEQASPAVATVVEVPTASLRSPKDQKGAASHAKNSHAKNRLDDATEPVAAGVPRFLFVGPLQQYTMPPEGAFGHTILTESLDRDDSIYLSLKRHGVKEAEIIQLVQAIKPVFNSKRESKPNDLYQVALNSEGEVAYFRYTPKSTPERPVFAERKDGELKARRLQLTTATKLEVIQAVVEENLTQAIQGAGEQDLLIDLIADHIFGSVIDFTRDTHQGDRIDLIFEKVYLDDKFIRYGNVELARYEGSRVNRSAFFYENPQGVGAYYDEDGSSLARMFLLSPLPYRTRISSRFSRRRFHPILKKPVPHLGTDYAAPSGTRVRATARGKVVHAGWKGGYGKLVEIKHANGYRTRYAHLRRISVKNGRYVEQEDVIGRVGATGRATGPHLHYELIKSGTHKNPERANKNTKGNPVSQGSRKAFASKRERLLDLLDSARTRTVLPSIASRNSQQNN